jgi:hypothetical protein
MTRGVLVLLGLAVSGLGLASLLRPVEMAAIVELPLASPTARTDVRAIYGGVITGVGVFLLACALRRDMVRAGLAAAACVFSGAALGRFFGLTVEGFGQPLMVIVMLLETMAAGLAIWGILVEPGVARIGAPRIRPTPPPTPAAKPPSPPSPSTPEGPRPPGGTPVR